MTVITIGISLLALVLSMVRAAPLDPVRHFLVFFALGAGNIHLAVIALSVFLFVNNGYRLPEHVLRRAGLIIILMVILIIGITLFSPITERTVVKVAHLGLYIFILFQILQNLSTPGALASHLKYMSYAAVCIALVALALFQTGITQVPHIYLGRGGNEGSVFLTLMGVLPALALFLTERRKRFLIIALILVFVQYLCQSRSNYVISAGMILGALYFAFNSRVIKSALVLLAAAGAAMNLNMLTTRIEGQINFSALERLELARFGWQLWLERPLTGWGWGSTSELVPRASLTAIDYPDFHHTWLQLIVELGIVGWMLIAAFVAFALRCLWLSFVRVRDPAVSAYVLFATVGLIWLGFFEALTFGADRMIQVLFVLPFMGKLVEFGMQARYSPLRNAPPAPVRRRPRREGALGSAQVR